jgi:hypothetical protein
MVVHKELTGMLKMWQIPQPKYMSSSGMAVQCLQHEGPHITLLQLTCEQLSTTKFIEEEAQEAPVNTVAERVAEDDNDTYVQVVSVLCG